MISHTYSSRIALSSNAMLFPGYAWLLLAHWVTGCPPEEDDGGEDLTTLPTFPSTTDATDDISTECMPERISETTPEIASESMTDSFTGCMAGCTAECTHHFTTESSSDSAEGYTLGCIIESTPANTTESSSSTTAEKTTQTSSSSTTETMPSATPGATPSTTTLRTITVTSTHLPSSQSSNSHASASMPTATAATSKKVHGLAHLMVSSFTDHWCAGRDVLHFTMKEGDCVAFPGPQMPGALTNDDPAVRYRIHCYYDSTCRISVTGEDARSASGVCSDDGRVGSCKLLRL